MDEDIHDDIYGIPGRYYYHDSFIAVSSKYKYTQVRYEEWEVEDMIDLSGLEYPFLTLSNKSLNAYQNFFLTYLKVMMKEFLKWSKK